LKATISGIIGRVQRKKAVGIIYNMGKEEQESILGELKGHIAIDGRRASSSKQIKYRLRRALNVKQPFFDFNWLPELMKKDRMIIVHHTITKPSLSKVFIEIHKNKTPLLILMNGNANIKEVRKLPGYLHTLTIEQDYSLL
jgi:hypothetical protein